MKNRMSVLLRLIVGLVAVTAGMTAGANTNALTASYAEKIDRDIRRGAELEAVKTIRLLEKSGGRAALPFLEKIGLSTNAPSSVRSRAAETYVELATAEECTAFLPKIFEVGNEVERAGGWRNRVIPAGLAKIDAAIAKHELSDETVTRFQTALLMFVQSTDNSWEAKNADEFLAKHCEGYSTSKQRVALWRTMVTTGNEWSKEKYAPLSESLEAIPPRKRVDLRDRFPGLPPPPEDKNAGKALKVALMIGAGIAALAAACAAILTAVKRGRARNHADGQPDNPR